MSSRRLVETIIGQLTERFYIEKVRTRDTWHLASRFILNLKLHFVLAHLIISSNLFPFLSQK